MAIYVETSGAISSSIHVFTHNETGANVNSSATNVIVPQQTVNFLSGHVMMMTLAYSAPGGSVGGSLTETVQDTVTGNSWSYTYTNINIQKLMTNSNVDGQFAYAGFTATSAGSNEVSDQDILNWTWTSGDEYTSPMYSAQVTLGSAQSTGGAVFDSEGHLVRTLWQAVPLGPGTYDVYWDGLDQYGAPVDPSTNPGPYSFRVEATDDNYTVSTIGNDTEDPADPAASYTSWSLQSVAVSPDGSRIFAGAYAGDTADGLSTLEFDGSGDVLSQVNRDLVLPGQSGGPIATDSEYIYMAEPMGWGDAIFKFEINPAGAFSGFTDAGLRNPDGSSMAEDNGLNYLVVVPKVYDLAMQGIAVSNYDDPDDGSIWVTDNPDNLVRQYNKVTGAQVGEPFAVDAPTGIALDASGDLWVAHGAGGSGGADVISVYTPSGSLIRDVSEATGLVNVASLSIVNGKLYVADQGAGRVLVYTISGDTLTDGGDPTVVGSPATVGNDDGEDGFWTLNDVTADEYGNIYTVQDLFPFTYGRGGTQLEKWSLAGVPLWVKGGYEYQSNAGTYSPSDPTVLYSTSLHRYTIDAATQQWSYSGTSAYPGYNSDPWSEVGVRDSMPPQFVTIGGTEFDTMTSGDKIIFFRTEPDGELHPATIVGAGGSWTATDGRGRTPRATACPRAARSKARAYGKILSSHSMSMKLAISGT